MITNPDVFPRDNNWARRHADIIAAAPADQTKMFGAPLYYDDGSLMHHGMYFEVDSGVSVRPDGIYARPMIRTEHYGKGAPVWSQNFACPRPVAAVTGAFISADRDWFEKLGGFNEDFLFGHYEDADLSLKSLARGQPAWIQDFPLWHMEGKGSTRRQAQEGGILVNRWLFTRRWGGLIGSHLRGPAPIHPSLAMIQSEGEAVLSAAGGAPEPASDSATFHAARRAGY
jgi:GT2 family glycosyltransferase